MTSEQHATSERSFEIREARAGDEACIAALTHQIAAQEGHPDWCTTTPDQVKKNVLEGGWAQVLMAVQPGNTNHATAHESLCNEAGEQVLGMVMYYPGIDSYAGERLYFIENLVVDNTVRRGGVGLALVHELERRARIQGVTVLSWECAQNNQEAQRFYKTKMNAEIDDEYMLFRKQIK